MSYHVQLSKDNSYILNNYSESFTTGAAYNETLKEADNSSISATVQYIQNIKNAIAKALLITEEISNEQIISVLSFLIKVTEIEKLCEGISKKIYLKISVENEFVFYRKTNSGLCLFSIDSDGDVLFNYTGYQSGFETKRQIYQDGIDFEGLIYNFLSK